MFTSGSPSSGQLNIGIALVLQDRFSNQAREASAQIRRLHHEAKIATNANLHAVKTVATAGAAAGVALMGGLYSAVRQGAEFVDVMTQVGAIARKDGISIEELSSQAQSLGRDTMFSSMEIASGMQYFAMAGMSTKEIKNNMGAVANLAAATKTELGGKLGAADIMTNIMKMFKIASTELNSTRVSDVLTKGVTSANMSLTDLAETIKYAGTTATNLGASLEQVVAFSGVLGNAGIQGSMAGTAISNAFRYFSRSIADPNYKGNKVLRALGLSKEDFVDANGQLIDIGLAMSKLNKATEGMDDIDRFNTLVSILGVRGERGGTVMIKAFDEYSRILNEIQNNSQGTAQNVMDKRMASIKGGIDIMESTWENLKTTFTTSVAPILTPIFKGIGTILEGMRSIMAQPVMGKLIAGVIVFGTVLVTVRLGLLALKATLKLTFNDSLISVRNMFMVMKAGWSGATIDARRYQMTEAAIIAQRGIGIVGNATGKRAAAIAALHVRNQQGAAALAANRGQWVGNTAMMGMGGYYWMKTAAGGQRRVTQAVAERAAGRSLARAGAGAAAGLGARALAGAGLRGGIALVGRGLGAVVGLLGGPIGIGLTALMLFLPMIIEGFSKNKDTQQSNTKALEDSTTIARRQLEEDLKKQSKGLTPEEQNILLIKALNDLTTQLKAGGAPLSSVTVNVDGKQAMTRVVNDVINQRVLNVTGLKP